jgi:hypothetical protein
MSPIRSSSWSFLPEVISGATGDVGDAAASVTA